MNLRPRCSQRKGFSLGRRLNLWRQFHDVGGIGLSHAGRVAVKGFGLHAGGRRKRRGLRQIRRHIRPHRRNLRRRYRVIRAVQAEQGLHHLWLEGTDRLVRHCGGGAVAGRGQGVFQRADDQATHQVRITETYLGLGRVDVDIKLLRIDLDKQGGQRMAVARQKIGIGSTQGAGQQLVAYRAVVDEQVLVRRIAA